MNEFLERQEVSHMEEPGKIMARIGMVNYLNTAPIHEKWKSTVVSENWQLVEALPSSPDRANRHSCHSNISRKLKFPKGEPKCRPK